MIYKPTQMLVTRNQSQIHPADLRVLDAKGKDIEHCLLADTELDVCVIQQVDAEGKPKVDADGKPVTKTVNQKVKIELAI